MKYLDQPSTINLPSSSPALGKHGHASRGCLECSSICSVKARFCPGCGIQLPSVWYAVKQQLPAMPNADEYSRKIKSHSTPASPEYKPQRSPQKIKKLGHQHPRRAPHQLQKLGPLSQDASKSPLKSKPPPQFKSPGKSLSRTKSGSSFQRKTLDAEEEVKPTSPVKRTRVKSNEEGQDHDSSDIAKVTKIWITTMRKALSFALKYQERSQSGTILRQDKLDKFERVVHQLDQSHVELPEKSKDRCQRLLEKLRQMKDYIHQQQEHLVHQKLKMEQFEEREMKKLQFKEEQAAAKADMEEPVDTSALAVSANSSSTIEKKKRFAKFTPHLFLETYRLFRYEHRQVLIRVNETPSFGLAMHVYEPKTSRQQTFEFSELECFLFLPTSRWYRMENTLADCRSVQHHWKFSIEPLFCRFRRPSLDYKSQPNNDLCSFSRHVHRSGHSFLLAGQRTLCYFLTFYYSAHDQWKVTAMSAVSTETLVMVCTGQEIQLAFGDQPETAAVYRDFLDHHTMEPSTNNSLSIASNRKRRFFHLWIERLWIAYTSLGYELLLVGQSPMGQSLDIPETLAARQVYQAQLKTQNEAWKACYRECGFETARRCWRRMELRLYETHVFRRCARMISAGILVPRVRRWLGRRTAHRLQRYWQTGTTFRRGVKRHQTLVMFHCVVRSSAVPVVGSIHSDLDIRCFHPTSNLQSATLTLSAAQLSSIFMVDDWSQKDMLEFLWQNLQVFRSTQVLAISLLGNPRESVDPLKEI